MEPQVASVELVEPRRLRVHFTDGLSGEIEFRESFFQGVFEVLRDPTEFAKVRCDQGFVEWPEDLDLAPDAMYAEIRRRGRWVLK